MALTKFDLISQAFIKLDAETVASFDDGTREAEIAATLYDNAKESERSSYPWNFTQKTFQLSQETGDPVDKNWLYKFLKPSDSLLIQNIIDASGNSLDYKVENDRVFCNTQVVIAKYIANIDEADLPAYFVTNLIARLQSEFAQPITGAQTVIANATREYQAKNLQAKRMDAQANPPSQLITDAGSTWLAARGGAFTYNITN